MHGIKVGLNATNSTGLQAATRSLHPSFMIPVQTGVPDNEKMTLIHIQVVMKTMPLKDFR